MIGNKINQDKRISNRNKIVTIKVVIGKNEVRSFIF
ncbi:MAG: hypothetical protein KatS3mg095_0663 [Candidatus Parcubacteria bacterium]|nr:MAG: hypothetical protein KatS3mg095_0663 [Candidatus Parcubacteria bacterium]